jgi:hypothetical protein
MCIVVCLGDACVCIHVVVRATFDLDPNGPRNWSRWIDHCTQKYPGTLCTAEIFLFLFLRVPVNLQNKYKLVYSIQRNDRI